MLANWIFGPKGELTRHLLLAYLVTLPLLLVTGLLTYQAQERQSRDALIQRLGNRLAIDSEQLRDGLKMAIDDLRIFTHTPCVEAYLADPSEENRRLLEQGMANLAQVRQHYDQVRLLDEKGHERVRINWSPASTEAVPEAELQDKHQRYYFQQSIQLEPEEIYLSPLDLNIENGAIEQPLKPMLRLASPVTDAQGYTRGVLVLNYLAGPLLEEFLTHIGESGMLLNADGYWLTSADPRQNWGFMFDHGTSFAARYPSAWAAIRTNQPGHLLNDEGLFVFTPLAFSLPQALRSRGGVLRWYAVSFTPSAALPTPLSLARSSGWLPLLMALGILLPYLEWRLLRGLLLRRRARQALAASERRLHEVADTLGEGLFVLDTQGDITFANREASRLLERPLHQLLGHNLHQLLHTHADTEAQHPAEACPIEQTIRQHQRHHHEDDQTLLPDGHPLDMSLTAVPLMFGESCQGAVVTLHDISARKRAEQELIDAREAALVGNRSKGLFLAQMSHDLRTPLNAVLGYAQILLRDRALSGPQRRSVEQIMRASERLLEMIGDILDLSKVEAGHLELNPVPTRLPELLHELCGQVAESCRSKGLELACRGFEQLPHYVEVDAHRLGQVVGNLLSNAVKFTQQGEVRVVASYAQETLTLVVSDTGPGIAEEQIEHIFEPFVQSGDLHNRSAGSGLGLAITQQLLGLMGGECRVQSQLGLGSSFTLSLPLRPLASAPPRPDLPQPTGYLRRDGVEQALKLLLVDDNPGQLAILQQLLAPLGFQLVSSDCGNEALHLLRTDPPDALIAALQLDEARCNTLVQAVREVSPTHIPLIATSGRVLQEELAKAFAAGVDAVLEKPVRLERLLALLAEQLPLSWHYALDAEGAPEGIPAHCARQLRAALDSGNDESFHQALVPLRQSHPELVVQLKAWYEEYAYHKIYARLDALPSEDPA